MNLREFFKENDIVFADEVYCFRDKKKRMKKTKRALPAHSPWIIKGIIEVFDQFRSNYISIMEVEQPVLVAVIQKHLGYTKDWSYTISGCLYSIYFSVRKDIEFELRKAELKEKQRTKAVIHLKKST